MTEFRHKIGDCLYDLYTPYEMNDAPDEVWMYSIRRRTSRYVYVHRHPDHRPCRSDDHLVRFAIADLETKGRAWNQANRMDLYTRPLPHWPLLVVSIDRQRALRGQPPRKCARARIGQPSQEVT